MSVEVLTGDCLEVLGDFDADTFDSVVTDPPYGLAFMGKAWDHGVPGVPFWKAVLRVLKPGGYMLTMGGTRTWHRLAVAAEDAGFEIRDTIMWLYGQGFPKGRACLKPAFEPVLLCRKPGPRVLPLGVDECRVNPGERVSGGGNGKANHGGRFAGGADNCGTRPVVQPHTAGRWPANVVHDGSDEVLEAFAAFGESKSPRPYQFNGKKSGGYTGSDIGNGIGHENEFGDTGTAARFFYCAKASRRERGPDNSHPTVKPLALMRWLVKLVTPPDGLVLDPFGGSGTTGKAAQETGRRAVLIEREPAYAEIARKRCAIEGMFAESAP